MNNKNIFAENLSHYMKKKGKSRQEICRDLGFNYYTFSDWMIGRKYPRMDKVEMLADYFGIKKSDLIEEHVTREQHDTNSEIVEVIFKLRTSPEHHRRIIRNFLSIKMFSGKQKHTEISVLFYFTLILF